MADEAKTQVKKEVSKIGSVKFRFFGCGYQGRLLLSTYPSGNTRMDLDIRDMHHNWERFAELSVDLPELEIPRRLFPFRNHGPLAGLLEALAGQGLTWIKKTVKADGREYPIVHWATSIERKNRPGKGHGADGMVLIAKED